MPPRPLRAPPRLDIRMLAGGTALHDAVDAAPPPPPDADIETLTRWSIAPLGGVVHLMGLDDFREVLSIQIDAYGSDGTWARRLDGSYVRLSDPWPLPLAPKESAR